MNETIYGEFLTQEHHEYLICLRDSGVTNMWGASPYIQQEFGVTHQESKNILVEWIRYMSKAEE